MTKQERMAIYMMAKQNIAMDRGYGFLCGQFANILDCTVNSAASFLPEFELFDPTIEERKEYGIISCWFHNKAEDGWVKGKDMAWHQIERMICLEMCLHMIEDDYFPDDENNMSINAMKKEAGEHLLDPEY